ncbi:MAG: PfkB domain protein [Bryobacterales bacterium]|nr:PfkB domain protein [Bryobacterales bacterium]
MKGGVLCSGSIVYDTLVRPVEDPPWGTTTFVETIEYHPGGNGANTSLALAALGTPVRLLGAVGDDDRGTFVVDRIRSAGVQAEGIVRVHAPTATSIVIVNGAGDRKFLHHLGASAVAFESPPMFDSNTTSRMSHYHLASLFVLPKLRPQAPETLMRARAAGLATSLDTNWDAAGQWMRDLRPCMPHLDVIFMNEDELRMVTGYSDPKQASRVLLTEGVQTAVLKLGSRGCGIYTRDEQHLCPAFNVPVKDTTGAGDCFVAGFLAARLAGASLPDAGCFANAVAALTVQNIGAVMGIRRYSDVQAWMQSAPRLNPVMAR